MQISNWISKTPSYQSWKTMVSRCTKPYDTEYGRYGARGIKVCKRWLQFKSFVEDMGERPVGKTLDRIDSNKGYFKENCRWATPKEQSNNRKTNVLIEYRGLKLNITQWAEKYSIKKATLHYRLTRLHWPIDKALNTSVRKLKARSASSSLLNY